MNNVRFVRAPDFHALLNGLQSALSFKVTVWGLFIGLFSYIILRSILVDPLHDEVATYLHYIETGAIFGDEALLDANNHLLNSLWGRWMYTNFGNHFFLFRLGNVLAFPIYFWACVYLSKELILPYKRLLFVAALTCVPYLLDYFSYARGYGMALGFFFGALALWRSWMQSFRPALQVAAYALMLLAVCSSLIYLVSACLLITCFFCVQFLNLRRFSWRQHLVQLVLHSGFILALWPLIEHSLQLKEGGALYYGSLDGFWQVTGKSLSTYVLFCSNDFLKWVFIAGGIVIAFLAILRWRKTGLLACLSTASFTTFVFLAGNACAVLVLAKWSSVNYPEDRAGMYFVPLGIAALAFTLLSMKRWLTGSWVLLFFPVSLLATLNLHTSVFSPDDRMQLSFYQTVRGQLQPDDVLCVDPIQQITWTRFERLYQRLPHFAIARRGISGEEYDVIVTKSVFPLPAGVRRHYTVIARDPSNGYIAYRHGDTRRSLPFRTTFPANYSGSDPLIVLLQDSITEALRQAPLALVIRGELGIDTCYRDLQLIVTTTDRAGAIVRADAFNFRWYFGERRWVFPYVFPYSGSSFSDREVELKVYIWNPEKRAVRNRNSRIEWTFLKTTKNGTR